jgi:serine/threonine protein kinase
MNGTNRPTCPDVRSWQDLLEGGGTGDEPADLARHLETCATCQHTLETLVADPAVWDDAAQALAEQRRNAAPEPALRDAVARLKREQPPAAADEDLSFLRAADKPGLLGLLGPYEVREVIGRGGMGVVLKAFEPALHRLVAIKVMSAAVAGSATARRRFRREAQAAAAVSHDNVVTVHGVSAADGLPYLVMQYVTGESLQARLDRGGPLEVVEVVRIGLQAARGLAAAHAQGLIHRDIKPANLLLEDGLARVKITDFGLARTADDVGLTRTGMVAGTPEYMAPEQARGEQVDHRADLFSLGSVLYACCTGAPPFRGSTALAVLRHVSEQAPVPLRVLNREVPAWLEALVARLLAKDPAERIQSAAQVAALLEGYLAHLRQPATIPAPELPPPPDVHRISLPQGEPWAEPARWGRPRLGLLALVLLATLGLGMGWWLAADPRVDLRAEPAPARPEPADDTTDEGVWTLAFSPDGKRLVTAGGANSRPGQLQIWDVAAGNPLVTRRALPGVRAVACSPDGQVLATGHWGGDIKLRDPLTGRERATLTGHKKGINGLAFSPDGALLASAGLDKTVKLWDVKALRERQELLGHTGMVFSVAFFHHGRAIVTAGGDRTARIWDLDTAKERFVLQGHGNMVETVAVSPDDKVVATGSWDQTIKLWDADTGQETGILRPEGGWVLAVAFSPNGDVLASAGADGTVHFWDVASRKPLQSVPQHHWFARALAFSPDGKLLASGGEDKTAKVWDVAAGRDVVTLSASGAEVTPDAPEGAAPRAKSRGWLAAALVILGVLLAVALAAGLWVRQRRRAPVVGERAGPGAAPASVSFPCSGCGKRLKARAELARKKVKCPQCGRAVLVPASTPAQGGESPGSRPQPAPPADP